MAGRFPFDQSGGGNPLNNPQVRAALGLGNVNSSIDEAVYLQCQQELQRDFQLRQLLLQEQLDQYNQQNRIENLLQEQQLKTIGDRLQEFPDLQQHYSRILLSEQLQRNEERNLATDRLRLQAEEELRRRHLIVSTQHQQLEHHQNQNQQQQLEKLQNQQNENNNQTQSQAQIPDDAVAVPNSMHATPTFVPSNPCVNQSIIRDINSDSLAGDAMKRSNFDKTHLAQPDTEIEMITPLSNKKRRRSNTNTNETMNIDMNNNEKKIKSLIEKGVDDAHGTLSGEEVCGNLGQPSARNPLHPKGSGRTSKAALSFSTSKLITDSSRGSFGDLIEAALTDGKKGDAAAILSSMKKKETIEWSESEDSDNDNDTKEASFEDEERQLALSKGDTIILPNFTSFLPQLPDEPTLNVSISKRKKKKKFKGILDEDDSSIETKSCGKKKHGNKKSSQFEKDWNKKEFEREFGGLPYPIDPWWPTITSIKRERKVLGESNYNEECDENAEIETLGAERQFHANGKKIQERLKNNVEPGVLEKIPHCRIHRMAMKKKKNSSAPELVYCTQVTELYPNELMICCSQCGTWRHTACGGHSKQYSTREAIETPFEPVCDRCYAEEKILNDNPIANKRLDRQRCEQIRRGLTTSAAMRQHSFSKHGGTYKWPLGSVSATHIGGHTRSVHSRHDKAEKQWTDMATKLGRGYGHRPKEKVKVRTKELERLLISIEDAEGHTDRHNITVFLMQDTLKNAPVGFEKNHLNMFDPEDDQETKIVEADLNTRIRKKSSILPDFKEKSTSLPEDREDKQCMKIKYSACKRKGCQEKSRFDSRFCSDACGLSSLESDLLRTFFYSSDIHPSALRH